ncbi:MAG: homoaconitate hydratase, partial [Candidatus Binatia bacterium]|jgi:isopropylmalate/homocitrate/citramalate synthase|nr:homoaconitate hydratase [Candidatus Binatia bacterium]
VGFPVVSKQEEETVRAIVREGFRQIGITATVRAKKEDIAIAADCGIREIFAFSPVSSIHLKHKVQLEESQAEERILEAVEYGVVNGLTVNLVAEDTARARMDFVIPLFNKATRAGASLIMICDTVSVMTPTTIRTLVARIRDGMQEKVRLGIHCHNDFGLATANTLAAIEEGIAYPTTTINGIGERAGNAAMEEVVMASGNLLDIRHSVKTKLLYDLCCLVENYSGMFLAPNKPIAGYNAFRHESGIHVDGLLKNLQTYEPIRPETVGRDRSYVLGKHTGRNLIKALLQERDQEASPEQLDAILDRVKSAKEETPKEGFIEFKGEINRFIQTYLGFDEEVFWKIVKTVMA